MIAVPSPEHFAEVWAEAERRGLVVPAQLELLGEEWDGDPLRPVESVADARGRV